MIYANMAGYLVVAVSGLVLGTLVGSKLTTAMMSMVHALEARMATIEGAAITGKPTVGAGAEKHAAAIEAHAVAVTRLAGAIEKHAAAVDEHGAAIVAAAVEGQAAALSVSK